MTNQGGDRSGSGRGALLIAALTGALVVTLVLSALYLLVLRDEPAAAESVAAPTTTLTTTVPATGTTSMATPATSTTTMVTMTSPAAAPTATVEPTATDVAPGPLAIEQVRVITERSGRGHLIGPDMYQATTYGTAGVVFRWRSVDTSGAEVWGETCQVVSTVTGPGGYNHTDRSAECSGRLRQNELVLDTPGDYTITTSVTGADGATTVGTAGFQVIPE